MEYPSMAMAVFQLTENKTEGTLTNTNSQTDGRYSKCLAEYMRKRIGVLGIRQSLTAKNLHPCKKNNPKV